MQGHLSMPTLEMVTEEKLGMTEDHTLPEHNKLTQKHLIFCEICPTGQNLQTALTFSNYV